MMGEIRRGLKEAAMGTSGQGEKYLSPKTKVIIKIPMKFKRNSIKGRPSGRRSDRVRKRNDGYIMIHCQRY